MWIVLMIIFASAEAFRDVISRVVIKRKDISPLSITWGLTFFTALFLSPIVLYFKIPEFAVEQLVISSIISGVLSVVAICNYLKALEYVDISLLAPFVAFIPLFGMIFTPSILLITGNAGAASAQIPKPLGFLGIFLIIAGTYVINLVIKKDGFFEPVRKLFSNKGLRKVLFSCLIWGFTLSLDKAGLESINSTVFLQKSAFWGFCTCLSISSFSLLAILYSRLRNRSLERPASKTKATANCLKLMTLGLINTVLTLCYLISFNMAVVVYVVAVGQLTILFKIGFGKLFFKETIGKERLAGASIMLSGIVCISLANVF